MQPIAAQTSKKNRRQRFKGAGECQQQHRQPKEIQIEIDEKNHQKINEEIFFFFFLVFFFLLFVVLFVVVLFVVVLFVVVLLFLVAVASGAAGESVV
jgi:Flp pilus assembly protein TadB